MKCIAEIKGMVKISKSCFNAVDLLDLKNVLTYESPSFVDGEVDTFIDFKESQDFIFIPVLFFERNRMSYFSKFKINDKRHDKIIKHDIKNNIILKEDQVKIMTALFSQMKNGNTMGIVKASTGVGKTYMQLYLAYRSRRKAIILVYRDSLMKQFVNLIEKDKVFENCKLGIIKGKERDTKDKDIVVAMIETVMKYNDVNKELLSDFSLLMIDEVERAAGNVFMNAVRQCPAKFKIGWSATPFRRDGGQNVLTNNMGRIIVDATAMGIGDAPVNPHIVLIGHDFPLYPNGHEPKKATAYFENTVNANKDRTQMLLTLITHLANNKKRRILVMTDRTFLINEIVNFLRHEGHTSIVGLKGGVKQSVLDEAQDAQIVVSNRQFVSVGLSIKELNTLVFFSFNKGGIVQKVGRILRQDDGEIRLVFDIVDLKSKLSTAIYDMKVNQYKNKIKNHGVFYYRWGDIFNKINSTNYKKGDFIEEAHKI